MNRFMKFHHRYNLHNVARLMCMAALTLLFASSLFVSSYPLAYASQGISMQAGQHRSPINKYPTSTAHQIHSTSSFNDPVIFIHGIAGDKNYSQDCTQWDKSRNFIQGKGLTGAMVYLGYYIHDKNCPANLYSSGDYRQKCWNYDSPHRDDGTWNESIKHVACELAWYLWENYSQYGINVRLVPISLGGLIVRYALFRTQPQSYDHHFPPLINKHSPLLVSDVVDYDTPHDGIPLFGAKSICDGCKQGLMMEFNSDFMNELNNNYKSDGPQGANGTRWTLFGVDSDQGVFCDIIPAESAVYMDHAIKVVYGTYHGKCYNHTPPNNMQQDDNPRLDMTAWYCDPAHDSNCTRFEKYKNWNYSTTYPHPVNKMYLSLLADIFTEYPIPAPNSGSSGITAGPDGNLWFTERSANKIGKITPSGIITEYPIPTSGSTSCCITTGPDGNLWFAECQANQIGKITPSGSITEYPTPTPNSCPSGITAGPDGNAWFTEGTGNMIGKITPSGSITEYPIPTNNSNPYGGITTGPDGNLWFGEVSANQIGKITPSGSFTEYPIPTSNSKPEGITAGPDGNVWFTEYNANQIGKITPSGSFTEYPIPTSNSGPESIAIGPDGNLWFTELQANQIGTFSSSNPYNITEYPIPTANSTPVGITTGPDKNLWFTESAGNKIGKIILK